jgi:phosphopantothenate synthetase
MNSRQQGKSYAGKLLKEAFLDAGKKVLCIDVNGATMQSRKKHLTLIEPLPRKNHEITVIYDEYT